jgi:hypothetical protein
MDLREAGPKIKQPDLFSDPRIQMVFRKSGIVFVHKISKGSGFEGGKSRVLTVTDQSRPLDRDSANVLVPGVLPERAKFAARGPIPQTAVQVVR